MTFRLSCYMLMARMTKISQQHSVKKEVEFMRFSNLHQHSTFSDGKSTMEEVVRAAIAKNFVSIGFSDHSFTACDPSYCMKREQYQNYFAEIARLREKYAGQIDVLTGIEQDYFSEEDPKLYDYRIGSVHYLILNGKCYDVDGREEQAACIANEFGGDLLEYSKRYYELAVKNVEKNKPEIIGHFDVLSKFGVFDEDDPAYRKIAAEALDEAMKTTPLVEINTGAISRGIKTMPYPHTFLIERVLQNGGEVILSADSHHADTIDCHFAECCKLLRGIGFDHVVQRNASGFYPVPLE